MKKRTLATVLTALVTSLAFQTSAVTEVEDLVAPLTSTPSTATLYNPTGITIDNYLYVYLQGDDGVEGGGDSNCHGTAGDRIIAYRALITSGVPGTLQRVGRISPNVDSPTKDPTQWPPACTNPPAFYGPGQVFQATVNGATKFHLLADISDAFEFKTVWRAESTDGINWTWYISGPNSSQTETLTRSDTGTTYQITSIWASAPFFATTNSNFYLLNPILRSSAPLTNNATWWGALNYSDSTGTKVTTMQVEWSTGSPVIKVLTATSPSWVYSTATSGVLNFSPTALLTDTNIKTLHDEGGQYQFWGWKGMGSYGTDVSCNTSTMIQCTNPSGCKAGDSDLTVVSYLAYGRPFWLNTGPVGDVSCPTCLGSGFAWWPVTTTSIGSQNTVYSTVRSMPSGYAEARMYPFRWNSPTGNRYLYSITNDNNICTRFLFNAYYLLHMVRTTLKLYP